MDILSRGGEESASSFCNIVIIEQSQETCHTLCRDRKTLLQLTNEAIADSALLVGTRTPVGELLSAAVLHITYANFFPPYLTAQTSCRYAVMQYIRCYGVRVEGVACETHR